MDWLHNPIADLSGPAFLAFYLICAALVAAIVRLRTVRPAPAFAAPPPVGAEADPAKLAFLQGGANGLLRFTVFDLVRRDELRLIPGAKAKDDDLLERVTPAESSALTPAEAAVARFFITPRPGTAIFGTPAAREVAALGEARYGPQLRAEGLVRTPAERDAAVRDALLGVIVLLALSAYRLLLAQIKHHPNIWFLVVLTWLVPVPIVLTALLPRLTARGRELLGRLRTAYRPAAAAPLLAGTAALPLVVAVCGVEALAGTPYAPVGTMFARHGGGDGGCGSASSGGNSGSCSSGSCGGGGGCGG